MKMRKEIWEISGQIMTRSTSARSGTLGAAETNSTAGEGKETGMPGADPNAAHPLPEAFKAFFRDTASFIAELCGIRASLKSGDYDSHPEKWPEMNRRMYEDILPVQNACLVLISVLFCAFCTRRSAD